MNSNNCSRPDYRLARQLADWTDGARIRLMRLVDASRRNSIVELGAGWGYVAEQLANRVTGQVIALDHDAEPLESLRNRSAGRVQVVCADAHELPFQDQSVELIISHFAFLWFRDSTRVAAEVARVLTPNGAVALIEPDYGGLMEYPPMGLREKWIAGLQSHGADPFIGRRLPSLLAEHGFDIHVLFCDRYLPPASEASQFLLPLLADQQPPVEPVRMPDTLFLPLWLVGGFRRLSWMR